MMRNRILLKTFAVFFILEMLVSTVAPTVSYALTAGPTAPEFSSFEPVDTTDMVNLATGDLVYNIPLLEIPGPSGGYPLSLSYHAGIMPNEEASWVGLGWTLNPGSIVRTVNGYPDDQIGAKRNRVDHNSGGERSTFNVGVGLPGAGFGLEVSHDSNLGIGVGTSFYAGFGVGSKLIKGSSVGLFAGIRGGTDGYGGSYMGPYASLGIGQAENEAQGLGYNLGITTNFQSASFHAGLGSQSTQFLGVSISTKGIKPSMSVAGVSTNQVSSNAGRIKTEGYGFFIPIPIGKTGLFLNIGYNYLRYYSHESTNVNVIGALHASAGNGKNRDNWSFDSYALLDPDKSGGIFENNDPEKSIGGSFPSYDNYVINAQGVSGSIQPYIFQNGNLFRQNLKKQSSNTDYVIKYENTGYNFYSPVNFRFKNTFSNAYGYNRNEMNVQYDGQISFLVNSDGLTPSDGFNSSTQHLAGSNHIEWFTNQQIKDGIAKQKGFIDCNHYQDRELIVNGYSVASQIGGFMVTNESGVTYHYALPAYAFSEFSKSFMTGEPNDRYQTNQNYHPYAYTWLLTAVTGPDFVDRGSADNSSNGLLDKDDWGYWVRFYYDKHASYYRWRNPVVGTHKDINREVEFFSHGAKELYYLNSVNTKTHIAIFQKSERLDGKGVTNQTNGAFDVLYIGEPYLIPDCNPDDCDDPDPRVCIDYCTGYNYRYEYPQSTLKLDNIYLLKYEDYEIIQNGFDEVREKSVRVIKLQTDYSLSPNTLNSFNNTNINEKYGKLTLKELSFLGKGGYDIIPPIKFYYEKNPVYQKEAYDVWGFYKSDFNPMELNENLKRLTTIESAKDVDAWSLSRVFTSFGSEIKISYESDDYHKSVLSKQQLLRIKQLEALGNNNYKVTFHEVADLTEFFRITDKINKISLAIVGAYTHANGTLAGNCTGCEMHSSEILLGASSFPIQGNNMSIVQIGDDFIEVFSTDFTVEINEPKERIKKIPICCSDWCGGSTSYTENDCPIIFQGFPEVVLGGYLFKDFADDATYFGGGIRVKSISISSFSETRTTQYKYRIENRSTGVTSYEPFGFLPPIITGSVSTENLVKQFNNLILDKYSPMMGVARELPSPGIIYQYVEVTEQVQRFIDQFPTQVVGKKVFEFQVFDESMNVRMPMVSVENPYANVCKNSSGEPVPCFGDPTHHGEPVICFDQFGDPIACGTRQSTTTRPVTIIDFSAQVGSLKSITSYGENGQIISKIENHYLHDNKTNEHYAAELEAKFRNQGVISQIFNEYRVEPHDFGQFHYRVFSKKTEYPIVAIGQTVTDYKTGIRTSTTNLAFDFYTGEPTKVLSTDGYGTTYVTEYISAYKVDAYSGMTSQQIANQIPGMGLKVKNPKNKHMLTQYASSYTYKIDPISQNKLGLLTASIQTWSDAVPVLFENSQPGIWRKHASYSFVGDDNVGLLPDGLHPLTNNELPEFSAWNIGDPTPVFWQKNGQITLYDVYSHALEAKDLNDQFAATKMSLDQTRVFATAANSRYNEFAFTGAEEEPDANGKVGGGVIVHGARTSVAHTGSNGVQANAGNQAISYTFNPLQRTYVISVWSSREDAKIKYQIGTDSPIALNVKNLGRAGNWYLLEAELPASSGWSNLKVWCEANAVATHFDDFRVKPFTAAMTSYVYNQWGELTHILDNNNLYTQYEYDGMGRLVKTFKETFDYGNVQTSQIIYHYAGQQ